MRIKKARKTLPHVRCGHYRKHAPHVLTRGRFDRHDAYCNGEQIDPPPDPPEQVVLFDGSGPEVDPATGDEAETFQPDELGIYPEGRPTGVMFKGHEPAGIPDGVRQMDADVLAGLLTPNLDAAARDWPESSLYEAERSNRDAWLLLEKAHSLIRNQAESWGSGGPTAAANNLLRVRGMWAWCAEYDKLRAREDAS